jgi:hypothetical protein
MGKPAKRIRTEEDAEAQLPSPGGLLTRVLQGEAASDTLAAEVAAAAPYPHGVLRGLCDDAFLRRVREEAIDNLPATFKETDLFKMYQTVDVRAASVPSPLVERRRHSPTRVVVGARRPFAGFHSFCRRRLGGLGNLAARLCSTHSGQKGAATGSPAFVPPPLPVLFCLTWCAGVLYEHHSGGGFAVGLRSDGQLQRRRSQGLRRAAVAASTTARAILRAVPTVRHGGNGVHPHATHLTRPSLCRRPGPRPHNAPVHESTSPRKRGILPLRLVCLRVANPKP